jgi:hypothetical protein
MNEIINREEMLRRDRRGKEREEIFRRDRERRRETLEKRIGVEGDIVT